jgi:hypothetical protein
MSEENLEILVQELIKLKSMSFTTNLMEELWIEEDKCIDYGASHSSELTITCEKLKDLVGEELFNFFLETGIWNDLTKENLLSRIEKFKNKKQINEL